MGLLPLNTMLGHLNIAQVFDGEGEPCLFLAENASGSCYVAFLADEEKHQSLWLYASVSEARLERLLAGRANLKSLYTEPEDGVVFLVRMLAKGTAEVEAVTPEQLEADLLPPEDDFLGSEPAAIPEKADLSRHAITVGRPRSSAAIATDAFLAIATHWSKLLEAVLGKTPTWVAVQVDGLTVQFQTVKDPKLGECLQAIASLLATPTPEQVSASFAYPVTKLLEALLETLYQEKLTLSVKTPKAQPVLQLSYATVGELRAVLMDFNQRQVESPEVPQADNLSKLFTMLELIQQGETELGHRLALSTRHTNYYKHAARILDYIDESGALTSRGQYLLNLPLTDRYEVTMMFFESSPVGFAWLRYGGVKCLLDLEPESAEAFLLAQCPNLAPTTVGRRAQTLRYWLMAFKEHLPD